MSKAAVQWDFSFFWKMVSTVLWNWPIWGHKHVAPHLVSKRQKDWASGNQLRDSMKSKAKWISHIPFCLVICTYHTYLIMSIVKRCPFQTAASAVLCRLPTFWRSRRCCTKNSDALNRRRCTLPAGEPRRPVSASVSPSSRKKRRLVLDLLDWTKKSPWNFLKVSQFRWKRLDHHETKGQRDVFPPTWFERRNNFWRIHVSCCYKHG